MKRSIASLPIILYVFFAGCSPKNNNNEPFVNSRLNEEWLKEIIRNSDSTHSKPYFRREFVTASYYINKHDSTLCQVMRDSSEQVRQIIIEKNDIRTFYAQYYPNGQATEIAQLNERGKPEGDATQFYPNGKIKSKGKYYDGQHNGTWESYDESGKLISKQEYDVNGQMLKTTTY